MCCPQTAAVRCSSHRRHTGLARNRCCLDQNCCLMRSWPAVPARPRPIAQADRHHGGTQSTVRASLLAGRVVLPPTNLPPPLAETFQGIIPVFFRGTLAAQAIYKHATGIHGRPAMSSRCVGRVICMPVSRVPVRVSLALTYLPNEPQSCYEETYNAATEKPTRLAIDPPEERRKRKRNFSTLLEKERDR
jgi:hypothetical protein